MTYEYENPNEYYCENCDRQQSMEDLRNIDTSIYDMKEYDRPNPDYFRPCPPCPQPFPPYPPCPKPCPPCPKPCPPCPPPKPCPPCPPPKPCPKPKDKVCIRLVAVEACLNQCLPEKAAFGVEDLKQALASFENSESFIESQEE